MTNQTPENQEKLREILEKTHHRFKNNLQTQLSLMNIETATNRSYFDEKKVVVDRIFSLTHIYDLFYKIYKDEIIEGESLVSLQSVLLQFFEHLKISTKKIDFELREISEVKVDVHNLLYLSYILIEINDFRYQLDDDLSIEIYKKDKHLYIKFSFSSINDHQKFHELFENQYKIFDLLVLQLKGKFDYNKEYVKLLFPIL